MVERLKEAIEKAAQIRRQALEGAAAEPAVAQPAAPVSAGDPAPDAAPAPEVLPAGWVPIDWAGLEALQLQPERLARTRVITYERTDPAHVAFDVLRSRLIKAMRDNGWKRIAITSPTKGCGKTFVSVNLALSLSRQPDMRTLLLDLDLRAPQVAGTLGLRGVTRSMQDFLAGTAPPERFLQRIGDNLAVGMNGLRVRNAAELILERRTKTILDETVARLDPDLVICDLPPMLVNDDAFAFLPNVDAVLLVAAAGETRGDQIAACEQLFQGTNFLGVVLNKAESGADDTYGYGYGYGYG